MSENKKTKSRNTRSKATIENKKKEKVCHVHDGYIDFWQDDIRKKVCVPDTDYPLTTFGGNYYCIFHLPAKDKNKNGDFERILNERIKLITLYNSQIDSSRTLSRVGYDFRYVWFPVELNLENINFDSRTDFSNAIFTEYANFSFTTFFERCDFSDAKFLNEAIFTSAIFKQEVRFNSTIFISNAIFNRTIFENYIYFGSTIFVGNVYFDWANFLESSQIFFDKSRICNVIYFNFAILAGYFYFEGKRGLKIPFNSGEEIIKNNEPVFLDKVDYLILKKELIEKKLSCYNFNQKFLDDEKLKYKALLNFRDARIQNPDRITFHRVRLCPSWFIKVDSRKLVFLDVDWENIKSTYKNQNIYTELQTLGFSKIVQPNQLLETACRQLAVNAEENNLYEEASNFRYMGMETKRLDLLKKFSFSRYLIWLYKWSSGYGESWSWALGVLLSLILVIFPIIYTQTDFQTCSKDRAIAASLAVCESKDEAVRQNCTCNKDRISFTDAIVQSLTTATLQNVEYRKPLTGWGEVWIILEKIFAPLQAALLALAIRRKFMR